MHVATLTTSGRVEAGARESFEAGTCSRVCCVVGSMGGVCGSFIAMFFLLQGFLAVRLVESAASLVLVVEVVSADGFVSSELLHRRRFFDLGGCVETVGKASERRRCGRVLAFRLMHSAERCM